MAAKHVLTAVEYTKAEDVCFGGTNATFIPDLTSIQNATRRRVHINYDFFYTPTVTEKRRTLCLAVDQRWTTCCPDLH